MENVFGNNMFGNSNIDQMRQQLEFQQMQYQKMQQAQQAQQGAAGLLDEFKTTIAGLTQEEQIGLSRIAEFTQAKSVYESGFLDFLGNKFSSEYLGTPVGKQAMENLNETAKVAVKKIKDEGRDRLKKLEAMAALLESDPEVQKKIQEQINKK